MALFLDLITNPVILAATGSWMVTQIMKFFIAWIAEGKPDFHRLYGDGGMPSGHSATVVCTATMVGYIYGFGSAAFGIAFMLAIIVMHDATGVRREAGKQASVIIDILASLGKLNDVIFERDSVSRQQKLKTMVGHTPLQVFFGAILGFAFSIVYILIAGIPYGA